MFLLKNRGEVYFMSFSMKTEGIMHTHGFDEFNSILLYTPTALKYVELNTSKITYFFKVTQE